MAVELVDLSLHHAQLVLADISKEGRPVQLLHAPGHGRHAAERSGQAAGVDIGYQHCQSHRAP